MIKNPQLPKRPLDKRYKEGVDTGAMSKQTVKLVLKPVVKQEVKEYIPPRYRKLEEAKVLNSHKRDKK